MINEKLIEIINDLKNKKISDIEITDILLLNNYNIDEIKENLKHYNDTHGYVNYSYIDKYEKIQGKKFFDNTQRPEEVKNKQVKKEPVEKTKKVKEPKMVKGKKEVVKIPVNKKARKKMNMADFIGLLLIIMLAAFIVYVFLNYDVISKIKAFI